MDFAVDWTTRIDFDVIRSHRIARLQEKIREDGLDGVLTFRAEHIRYATNIAATLVADQLHRPELRPGTAAG
jgi:Xaa-Pro aminopeptidase